MRSVAEGRALIQAKVGKKVLYVKMCSQLQKETEGTAMIAEILSLL